MPTPGASGSASGGQLEEKKDYSTETDAKILEAQALDDVSSALALLSGLEKKCRVGNDTASLIRVCEASLELCRDDPELLLVTLQALVTRRSQKTTAIKAMVQKCLPWCMTEPYAPLEVPPAQEATRNQLVEALRDITDGKIFLERERAQLTRVLATIQERSGDVATAADTLQQVHVETYGSMSKKDKVEYILEQMRLTFAKKDFVRAGIVAGKISRKNLVEMEDYKVQFYTLLTIAHRHEKNALELAKDYFAIYSTPTILADEALWMKALEATVVFLALSAFDNEQQDMLHRVAKDTNLEKIPACYNTVQLLLKKEIIHYPMPHQADLEGLSVCQEDDLASHWHDVFFRRIVQHNIRVVALYYKRIHGSRLAQLLGLDAERLETEITSMVSDGTIYAKIDRPQDIVRFAPPKTSEESLSEWASDIDKLLHLVETTTHLINKENMTKQ